MAPKPSPKPDDSSKPKKAKGDNDISLDRLGKYEIVSKLGAGGMGTVFLATDVELKRRVALKVLSKDKAENPTLVKRFKAEARSAAQLEHENIVRIYDSGEADGYLYIALEYVEGNDLYRLMQKRGNIPVKRSIEIIKQTAEALKHAHRSNIVHRDIKPANLMITNDGMVKLADLGLARAIDDTTETTITRAGTTVGTVDYMAPEQARDSKAADIRSDIYSLGCTWYHMLTGKVPYPEGSLTNKLHAHASANLPDPRYLNDTIPAPIVAVIHKMISKKMEDRYQTPGELIKELANKNLTRGEVSNSGLEALAMEMESGEHEAPKGTREREREPSRGRKSSMSMKKTDSDFDDNELAPRSSSKIAKKSANTPQRDLPPPDIRKTRKKLSDVKNEDQGFQLNIKPFALITAILVCACVVYGGMTIFSGLGAVFEGDENKGSLKQAINDENNQTDAAGNVINSGSPALSSGKVAMTLDEYNAKKASQNQQVQAQTSRPEEQKTTVMIPMKEESPRDLRSDREKVLASIKQSDPARKVALSQSVINQPIDDTLSAIMQQLPAEGGIIELTSDGPYLLTKPLSISKRVIFAAADKINPVMIFRPSNTQEPKPLIDIQRGELEFRGVHLTSNISDYAKDQQLEFMTVTGGNVTLIDSSITVTGAMPVNGTAICLKNKLSMPTLTVVRSSFRGDRLRMLLNEAADSQVNLVQCLALAGSSPVMTIKVTGAPATSHTHRILIEQSLLVSANYSVEIENSERGDSNTQIQISTNETILGTTDENSKGAAVRIQNWPEDLTRSSGSVLNQLTWNAVKTVFTGWKQLAQITMPENGALKEQVIPDYHQWQLFWKTNDPDSNTKGFYFPITWSKTPVDIQLGNIQLTQQPKQGSAPLSVNFDASILSFPKLITLEHSLVESLRHDPVPGQNGLKEAKVIPCDLGTTDLGTFLSDPALPSPVIVELTGQGNKLMSPCKIVNKQIRLQFPRIPGNPVTMRPKSVTVSNSPSVQTSWIELKDSQLEIDGAIFQNFTSSKEDNFNWMIHADNSMVYVSNSYLEGPPPRIAPHKGLIRYTSMANQKAAPLETQLVVTNSFLRTNNTAIKFESKSPRILLQDSLIVAMERGLDITLPASAQDDPLGLIDLMQCSFSSAQEIFHLEFSDATSQRPQLGIIANESVFGPTMPAVGPFSGMFWNCNRPFAEQKKFISWWGDHNGYANDLKLTDNTESPAFTSIQDWSKIWDPSQETQSYREPDSVYLEKKIDRATNLSPIQLKLHSLSKAMKAGVTREYLGANIEQLEQFNSPSPIGNQKGNPANPNKRPMF
jgi:serine/threonine-protein kinase